MLRRAKIGALVLAVAAAVLVVAPSAGSQGNGASQIVLSGQVPPGTPTGTLGPMGFWIWCESPEAGNPYAGACAGSMYFYDLGLVRAVRGGVTSVSSAFVEVAVASGDGAIDCTLSADLPAQKGPRNDVTVTCSDPSGRAGDMQNSVVVVTS